MARSRPRSADLLGIGKPVNIIIILTQGINAFATFLRRHNTYVPEFFMSRLYYKN